MLYVRNDFASYVENAIAKSDRLLGDQKFSADQLLEREPKLDFERWNLSAWSIKPISVSSKDPEKRLAEEKIIGSAIAVLLGNIIGQLDLLSEEEVGIASRYQVKQDFALHCKPSEITGRGVFTISGCISDCLASWYWLGGENKYSEYYSDPATRVIQKLVPSLAKEKNICQIKVGGNQFSVEFASPFYASVLMSNPNFGDMISSTNMDTYLDYMVGMVGFAMILTGYYQFYHWGEI